MSIFRHAPATGPLRPSPGQIQRVEVGGTVPKASQALTSSLTRGFPTSCDLSHFLGPSGSYHQGICA
jgi:hypothetical protein